MTHVLDDVDLDGISLSNLDVMHKALVAAIMAYEGQANPLQQPSGTEAARAEEMVWEQLNDALWALVAHVKERAAVSSVDENWRSSIIIRDAVRNIPEAEDYADISEAASRARHAEQKTRRAAA